MSNGNKEVKSGGMGLFGLCVLWGIVTQCLEWAHVIFWPWFAIWGPALFCLGITALAVIIALIAAILAG